MKPKKRYDWANLSVQLDPPEEDEDEERDITDEDGWNDPDFDDDKD